MSIDSVHPLYSELTTIWVMMREVYAGERVIKARGQVYLPATIGMILDGIERTTDIGYKAYEAYKLRAVFPDYYQEAVETIVGLLHQKPPTIELPSQLEPLRQKATVNGESLPTLLRRINEEQLVVGRIGLLLDLPKNPNQTQPLPYIATYSAEAIINWDDAQEIDSFNSLNLVVLDESSFERNADFKWDTFRRFRVLQLGTFVDNEHSGTYSAGVFSSHGGGSIDFDENLMVVPVIRGKSLDKIPFVFINSKDIIPTPDKGPLQGLANLVLAIYRGEADYRQSLFMQGQDTLVVIGGTRNASGLPGEEDAIRTGAGSRIDIDQGGDAKYIGVSSSGLAEQREALLNDRKVAEQRAAQLVNNRSGNVESGQALKTRMSAQTATLAQIAQTGAAGLENILKIAAEWVGANPNEVKVTPNTEFADLVITGEDVVKLMTARTMGAPISKRSIHAVLVSGGLTKETYEDEVDVIEEEDAQEPARTKELGDTGSLSNGQDKQ